MFDRLKRALVESYIGAIALGYLPAQDLLYFAGIFTAPVASWVARNQYRELMPSRIGSYGFSPKEALPELMGFVVLLFVWYVLFRRLYFKPLQGAVSESAASQPPLAQG
jgi:hypothetical protein